MAMAVPVRQAVAACFDSPLPLLFPPPPTPSTPINIPKHSTRVEWLEWWKGWPERAAPSLSGVLGSIEG